ncbi:MAG: hypothetical protein WD336_07190 [Trueperaceae bacterium]
MINVNLLPKNLRRVREPGYWRALAVLIPVVALAVVGVFQYLAWQTEQNLTREVQAREDQLALLQPFIEEQNDLQARQAQLNELIAVRDEVRANTVQWTGEIVGLLETLPPIGDGPRPRIDFRTLSMRSVVPPSSNADRFEGDAIVAEMSIGGNVENLEVLASFVRNLEGSASYGVLFQNASRQGGDGTQDDLYAYSLTVGALETGGTP